jgi:hypothetical protein
VYVKNIKITLETVYVSGDVSFPDRSIYTKGNTSKLKVERIHGITGNIQEKGLDNLYNNSNLITRKLVCL